MRTLDMLKNPRFLVMLALGFSAGAPLPLVLGILRRWMTESGISLTEIGLTALIGLPYSLKFIWSPLLDNAMPPAFRAWGRRRGWLAVIQPLLMIAILAMGASDPVVAPLVTVSAAIAVAFLSASQDIVIDAYRIEMLDEREQGLGLAFYVWGYRLALLAVGAGVLALSDYTGWFWAFVYAAALVLVGFAAVWLGPDVVSPRAPGAVSGLGTRLRTAVVEPFADFMRRPYWLAILLFVALFKLGEALAAVMVTPFQAQLGFTRMEVAQVGSVFGLFATLLGALAGGWLVARIGTARALILTGLAQMLSNGMYIWLAYAGHDMTVFYLQTGVENFTDGLADAAFLTYLSALTSRAFTATQYALLSSLAAVASRTVGAFSGPLAEGLGWPGFFALTMAAALPAMCVMIFLLKRLPPGELKARPAAAMAE
ncbi:AmpG family muropeptide MFS transporter [Roseomonas marmotae]|uniref:MFS transporter n=1 Tax=Roseomonas marmotae TaxID=2768161 RepID=A0ABS3KBN4_9PROT|nr:MFS transporter [Roseomonas marmotae]MBO1074315.1 MFS transporter [Roseomonas marmotae]QTI78068.1 MFS transporter [Roseomonas marmotae]